jgi:pimeloyl-ACP methyl ester carboxylesterase
VLKIPGQRKALSARTNRWLVAAAIAALILGALLSRVIDPGIRVEKIMLVGNTPALRLFPAAPGPHPKALLAHGNGGSKEMLFRFGEALATAGFDCYSVDQAGNGEVASQQSPVLRVNGFEFYWTVTSCQGSVVHSENSGSARRCRRAGKSEGMILKYPEQE